MVANPNNSKELVIYDDRLKDSKSTGLGTVTWSNWDNPRFNVDAGYG